MRKIMATIIAMVAVAAIVGTGIPSEAAAKAPKKLTLKATSTTVDIKGKATVSVKSVSPSNASKSVSWKSSNTKVASISSKGVVTGKKAGKTTITAISKKNKKVKKTITITVKNLKATAITLNKKAIELTEEDVEVLKATVKAPAGFYNEGVKWTSSNASVVTVDNKGRVTAVKEGTATITVIDKSSGKKAITTVTVVKKAPPKAIVVYYSHGENCKGEDGEDLNTYADSLIKDNEADTINAITSASIIKKDGKIVGNMTYMAEWIADAVGAETYSIKVKDLYPANKKKAQERVRKVDHTSSTTPAIEKCDIDFSQYDVIYLGFPNWYGEPPRALYTFFNENNIDGKTIVPFTSVDQEKYGFGDAINILKSKLPNSPIVDLGVEDELMVNRKVVLSSEEYIKEKAAQSLSIAAKAKANPLATETAKMEAAKTLIGQTVTDDQIKATVGQWVTKTVDVNGCTHEVSSVRYFYPGFVIYSRADQETKSLYTILSVD